MNFNKLCVHSRGHRIRKMNSVIISLFNGNFMVVKQLKMNVNSFKKYNSFFFLKVCKCKSIHLSYFVEQK